MMDSGPPTQRRDVRRSVAYGRKGRPSRRPADPMAPPPADRRETVRLVVVGIVIAAVLTTVGIVIRQWRAPAGPPAEVTRIANGIRMTGLAVDRIARNANGGWSILTDDGEVQWFKAPSKAEARLHPIRVLYEMRHDPNVAVLEVHPTVFVVILSGRRQGSTIELGTARTSAEQLAKMVQTAVGVPQR